MQILCTAILALVTSVLMTKVTAWTIMREYRPGPGGQFVLWLLVFLPLGIWGSWGVCLNRILAN